MRVFGSMCWEEASEFSPKAVSGFFFSYLSVDRFGITESRRRMC